MKRFPVIGVTGLPCSGKTFAARLLASGAVTGLPPGELLLADDIGHDVLLRPEVREELRGRFGEAVFAKPSPSAVRRAVADRVFADPAALAWLEGIVHPRVLADIDAGVARNRGVRPVVVESALLFTPGLAGRCDVALVVTAERETRRARARGRGWDEAELARRERPQEALLTQALAGPLSDRIRIVENNGGKEALVEALRLDFCKPIASV